MARKPTKKRNRTARGPTLERHIPFSSPQLKSAKLVAETLLECIKTGDLEAFRDVLTSHLMIANKMQLAKKAGLGRRTLYDIVDRRKKFNPELSTVSAVIRALAS
jgi:DNA-binding phage protein